MTQTVSDLTNQRLFSVPLMLCLGAFVSHLCNECKHSSYYIIVLYQAILKKKKKEKKKRQLECVNGGSWKSIFPFSFKNVFLLSLFPFPFFLSFTYSVLSFLCLFYVFCFSFCFRSSPFPSLLPFSCLYFFFLSIFRSFVPFLIHSFIE